MISIMRMVVGYVSTNCYIVRDDELKECVIVDPGDNADGIEAKIKEAGVKPVAILLTHGHFDHITAVPELREKFPDIPVYAYKEERVLLENAAVNESRYNKKPIVINDVHYLEDGEELTLLNVSWKVISTPGHTVGSGCYYIKDAGVLFSGDTLFDRSYGRTDFATGDTKAIIHSIRDVLMQLPDDTNVLPGHETFTTIGTERLQNPVMYMDGRGV